MGGAPGHREHKTVVVLGSSESFCAGCAQELGFRRQGDVYHMKWLLRLSDPKRREQGHRATGATSGWGRGGGPGTSLA